ncbi:hypothetical protein JCM10213_001443 [Rhodosporidiobolus nylandii]
MLDRLPPELLDKVLELAAPVQPIETYGRNAVDHKPIVCACSLVCRAVRERAQPLLWRRFEPVHLGRISQLASLGQTRLLELDTYVSDAKLNGAFLQQPLPLDFLSSFSRLDTLHLSTLVGAAPLDLEKLAITSHLRRLFLERVDIKPVIRPITFPTLEVLSMSECAMLAQTSAALFVTATFPSLRAFAWMNLKHPGTEDHFFPSLSPAFISQLDMMQMYSNVLRDGVPTSTFLHGTPILLSVPVTDLTTDAWLAPLHRLPNLRVRLAHLELASVGLFLLMQGSVSANLVKLVSGSNPPRAVQVLRAMQASARNRNSMMGKLVEACERNGVEMLWHDEGEENDVHVSPSFWQYAKELKAAQAAADAA